jgi:hypothetical protein
MERWGIVKERKIKGILTYPARGCLNFCVFLLELVGIRAKRRVIF